MMLCNMTLLTQTESRLSFLEVLESVVPLISHLDFSFKLP